MESTRRLLRKLPWWLILLFGVACVLVGGALVVRPFRSLGVLAWVVVIALLLMGVTQLASAETRPRPWLSVALGIVWLVVGVAAAFAPGLTLQLLVIVIGVALVASGGLHIYAAVTDKNGDRLILVLSGIASLLFGALALMAPAATQLVIAILFGVYVVVIGVHQILLALRLRTAEDGTWPERREWSRGWRLVGAIGALVLAVAGLALLIFVQQAQPAEPGAFYAAPNPLPAGEPGTIVRTEVMEGFRDGATAYRTLYLSTALDGSPSAVSGILIVPDSPAPADGRNVVAWTHGTVGVSPPCAPSLVSAEIYGAAMPALDAFIDAGYVVAAPDYQGLGTAGRHPYLVGDVEGKNALDSVRAAINLPDAQATPDFVVWGESQGGHASLFTGQLAASYAPELNLVGVVASAPASDLLDLFKTKLEKPNIVGNMLISMAGAAWADVYPNVSLDTVVYPAARSLVRSIADNCIQDPQQIQASLPAAALLNMRFFSGLPWEDAAWNETIVANTPGAQPTGAPILIGQGDADEVISPAVQAQFAEQLCAQGETVEYRTYPGVGHLTIAHDTAPEVVEWIAARFAGEAPISTCGSGS